MWIKRVYLSPVAFSRSFKYNDLHFENPTTAKTNIWANTFQNLWNQDTHLHFQQKRGGTFQTHEWSVTTDIRTIYWHTWLLVSKNHHPKITGISTAPRWRFNAWIRGSMNPWKQGLVFSVKVESHTSHVKFKICAREIWVRLSVIYDMW